MPYDSMFKENQMTQKVNYPLDETGSSPNSRTQLERQSVAYNESAQYLFYIPDYAPFYTSSFRLFRIVGGNRIPLVEGVDFHFGLKYESASLALAKSIFSSIVLIDMQADSIFELELYQTLGGNKVLDTQKTAELIARVIYNPASMTWEEVLDKPEVYRSVDHVWKYSDQVGQSQIVQAIVALANTLASRRTTGGDHHMLKGNVHDVSRFDLGLDKVPNYPVSDIDKMVEGNDHESLVTPALVHSLLMQLGILDQVDFYDSLREHLNTKHASTPADVGLERVANQPQAGLEVIARNVDSDHYITLTGLKQWMRLHGGAANESTKEPIPQGALMATYCNVHYDRIGVYADGRGGTYESVVTVRDKTCGYRQEMPIAHLPKGEVLHSYCSGTALMELVSDGAGGVFPRVGDPNSPKCTGSSFPPKGTVLARNCEGTTLVRTVADGSGGSIIERVEDSQECGANNHPPKGTLLNFFCNGYNSMGRYADGVGGFYEAVIKPNDPECGYQAPTTPPENTHPPAGTLLGTQCQGKDLYGVYANGSGGTYTLVRESNSLQCGGGTTPAPTTSPTPTPTPVRNGTIRFTTTLNRIYIGDTEVQTYTISGWKPNTLYKIGRWNNSTAWGEPYERMLDTVDIVTDANGSGSFQQVLNEVGIIPVGRYISWVTVEGTSARSANIERIFMGNRT